MSDAMTPRLMLPYLQAGQAQKELSHNEALALLDIAVQPIVEAVGALVPPIAPVAGLCWILGTAPTGAWSGHGKALAGWTIDGWRFLLPSEGMSAWSRGDQNLARFLSGQWDIGSVRARRVLIGGVNVVNSRQPAIAAPIGGSIIDTAARSAIGGILVALQQHGLIAS